MNKIKKIVFLAIAFSFLAGTAFAGTINNDPKDFSTLSVKRADGTNEKWSRELKDVKGGEAISFNIYYHATDTPALYNLKAKMKSLDGRIFQKDDSESVDVELSADNAATVSDSVKLNFGQKVKLELFDVSWQPNQCGSTKCSKKLLDRQEMTDIFSENGLNLGTIKGDWKEQGSVVVTYKTIPVKEPTVKKVVEEKNNSKQAATILGSKSARSDLALWMILAFVILSTGLASWRYIKHKRRQ